MFSREVQQRTSRDNQQSTGERHTRAFHGDSSYQAAGLEQQSDQSKMDEISTTEAENVDDSQSVSEVA